MKNLKGFKKFLNEGDTRLSDTDTSLYDQMTNLLIKANEIICKYNDENPEDYDIPTPEDALDFLSEIENKNELYDESQKLYDEIKTLLDKTDVEKFFKDEEDFDSLEDELVSRRKYLPDTVKCPDCDGLGVDEFGEECGRCDGTGKEYRPDDIPSDFEYDEIDDEDKDSWFSIKNESLNSRKIKSFKLFRESVGEYEDSFVDINIDETELEDSDRPNLGKLKQKDGRIIIENPSKTDAYNAKMRLGGDVVQEPGFSDKQMHYVKEDLTKTVTTGSGWDKKERNVTVGNLTLNSYAKKLYGLFKKEGAKVGLFSTALTKVGDMGNYQVGIDTASTKGSGIRVTINAGQNSMNMANRYAPLILKTFSDLEIVQKPTIISGWGGNEVTFILSPKKGTNLT